MHQMSQRVREYPDIPARVVGEAEAGAAQALWEAVAEWYEKNFQHEGHEVHEGKERAMEAA
jgi:hypothetical protein